MRLRVRVGEQAWPVEVREEGGRYRVRLGERWLEVDARAPEGGPWSLLVEGRSHTADLVEDGDELVVSVAGATYRVRVETGGAAAPTPARRAGGGERLAAPMPGRVVAVLVRPGDRVEAGSPLVVLEAMKMENEFRASTGGRVAEVCVEPGQAVNAGDLLVVLAAED